MNFYSSKESQHFESINRSCVISKKYLFPLCHVFQKNLLHIPHGILGSS